MDRFWEEAAPRVEPFKQKWYIPLLVLFVILSVPWYRDAGEMGSVIAGLPVWVWTSLACSLGVAVLTAIAALFFWADGEDE